MGFQIRLKTGFYETGIYELIISNSKLVLIHAEPSNCKVEIMDKHILNITFQNEKNTGIQIQTCDKTYQGFLCNEKDFEEMLELLKENLQKKIICEYEGGKANA